jgi:hypothetical protein
VPVGDFIAINPEGHKDPFWIAKVLGIRIWSIFLEWYVQKGGKYILWQSYKDSDGSDIGVRQIFLLRDLRIVHWGFDLKNNVLAIKDKNLILRHPELSLKSREEKLQKLIEINRLMIRS